MRISTKVIIVLVTLTSSFSFQAIGQKTNNDHLLNATIWYQRSGEMKALCYQAYNLAQLRLDQTLSKPLSGKLAIVVDIDETVLDNSPFEARCIVNKTVYPKGWSEWIAESNAVAIPGAVEFLNYTTSKNVEVFYISNRKVDEMQATIINLKKAGFPLADEKHLMLKTSTSNKEERRLNLLKTHNIIMLIGDNLNDFTNIFEKRCPYERNFITDSVRNEFGKRFIVLPNPMYGDWESSLFDYQKLTPEEQAKLRKEFLRLN